MMEAAVLDRPKGVFEAETLKYSAPSITSITPLVAVVCLILGLLFAACFFVYVLFLYFLFVVLFRITPISTLNQFASELWQVY